MDFLLNMESDDEWLNSLPQVYSVTITKFPTMVDFPIEIQGFKTNCLFDTGAQLSCIIYEFYRKPTWEKKNIDMNIKAKVSSADGSNLVHKGVDICYLLLGIHEFKKKVIVCKHLLHPVILGLDFAKDFWSKNRLEQSRPTIYTPRP